MGAPRDTSGRDSSNNIPGEMVLKMFALQPIGNDECKQHRGWPKSI